MLIDTSPLIHHQGNPEIAGSSASSSSRPWGAGWDFWTPTMVSDWNKETLRCIYTYRIQHVYMYVSMYLYIYRYIDIYIYIYQYIWCMFEPLFLALPEVSIFSLATDFGRFDHVIMTASTASASPKKMDFLLTKIMRKQLQKNLFGIPVSKSANNHGKWTKYGNKKNPSFFGFMI